MKAPSQKVFNIAKVLKATRHSRFFPIAFVSSVTALRIDILQAWKALDSILYPTEKRIKTIAL